MNSMEEKALFERWGWRQDLIGRRWVSPYEECIITYDNLYAIGGIEEEQRLVALIRQYGKDSEGQVK